MAFSRTLHIAVVGLGHRGIGNYRLIAGMENVRIDAVCDLYEDRVKDAADYIEEKHGYRPIETAVFDDLLAMEAVEAIMIFTGWEAHIPLSIAAMKAGKWVGVEVAGAYSVKQCWDLVRTYEETGTPIMMLENCCYGKRELMIANMAKRGLFGKVVHCEGGYHHDLRHSVPEGVERRSYRLRNYLNVNAHNYPTHDFGPIAKILGINRGNRAVSLVSMASGSFGMEDYIARTRPDDENLKGRDFALGDVITTVIKCAGQETITLTLDTSLPRFYSRGFTVQGTRGMYNEDSDCIYLEADGGNHNETTFAHAGNAKEYEQYLSPLWRPENADNVKGGHGGMDGFCFSAFFDHLDRRDKNVPIDVYDTATWMAITALSQQAIEMGSVSVPFPDFTEGMWIRREPLDCDDFTGPIPEKAEEPTE